MHIAFLTPEFPHSKVAYAAGIGTSINNLVTALIKQGTKVSVFVYGQKTQEIIRENGITIHLIKNKKYPILGWFFYRKYIQNYCESIIKRDNISVIEAPDWTGITAFMNFKIPLVIRFHGSDTYFCHLEKRKQKLKNYWFEKLALQKAKAFIAPTEFAGKLTNLLFKAKNKEIKVIHYGLELHKFQNDFPEKYEKNLILYIGTLIRKKGVLELPEIFNRVRREFPNAKLVLIGNDSYDVKTNSDSTWQLMQNQFDKRDLENVDYIGKIPYSEVQNFIKKANVCVFPTFAETLGMVTIESMAMQKAVVNSNIGWANELIEDGVNGFLVHPENHDLFAEKIKNVLRDEDFALSIGKAAREKTEISFDITIIAKQNIEFYKRIINPV
ncbi:glycosyltransferase family 4 protein [Flavobacterium sp. Fl-77]|uniref:Glycosyltransferase family 4 protein n=1 Tax=Flavobacterium flavipigmentatum TaxID=2893884 RepID=A0AAJ2SGW4_9FLAO|nr:MULTISPECIES: glycosyltransferase family 4 protein [unclassified Flavobacterium]MDX6182244.1 glycosyltransferase family 4 protein [Flavobacterium sp. Fl-33]MDX6185843.1 glycosyltransferase family 4 protein [Flavobacterium sp. Fl-77]UFH39022.1 glycosyltransferase family 4 protein [Flavobacterium sp. F-70]